ncbi:hypothetical protein EXIGLDRAFT_762010 [Exidia glandulosa HHB12029]|uniref:F-box domain-containing protein n=1 Tax=Exidia glandulosa HHB12029 TaxID=1314781 RepID=A0A165N390_EXIGL|nr:hypothetical protein EXIGLDRAFT_762010 [Exidia glandulosa HHB12029]
MGACLSSTSTDVEPTRVEPARQPYDVANKSLPCPIATVPFEILLIIFEEFCSITTLEGHLRHARILAAVCFTWRGLVLSESRFWQHMYVRGERALHDLRYAIERSRRAQHINLGIDYSEIRGVRPVLECPSEMFAPIFRLVDQHMERITKLTIAVRPAALESLSLLTAPAPLLTDLTLSVYNRAPTPIRFPEIEGSFALFSGTAPKLHTLSVTGMHLPIWFRPTLRSVQLLHIHAFRMEYRGLRRLLSNCSSSLKELHIHNCGIIDTPLQPANGPPAPLADVPSFPSLEVLSLDGLNRHCSLDRVPGTTTLALSALALGHIRTVRLTAYTWPHLDNEARTTFTALKSPIDTLEITRDVMEGDWHGVTIRAQTQAGHTRLLEVLNFPDSQLRALFSSIPAARTLRTLVLPLDWVPAFLYSSSALDLLEELTLTYNRGVFFPFKDSEGAGVLDALQTSGAVCPFLQTVIIDISRLSVVPKIQTRVFGMLPRLIEPKTLSRATVVLRAAIARNVTEEQRAAWSRCFKNVIVEE